MLTFTEQLQRLREAVNTRRNETPNPYGYRRITSGDRTRITQHPDSPNNLEIELPDAQELGDDAYSQPFIQDTLERALQPKPENDHPLFSTNKRTNRINSVSSPFSSW